jgi:hypothetical protein
MPEDLHQIAAPAAKDIQLTRVWITTEPLLHRQRQTVHASPLAGGWRSFYGRVFARRITHMAPGVATRLPWPQMRQN